MIVISVVLHWHTCVFITKIDKWLDKELGTGYSISTFLLYTLTVCTHLLYTHLLYKWWKCNLIRWKCCCCWLLVMDDDDDDDKVMMIVFLYLTSSFPATTCFPCMERKIENIKILDQVAWWRYQFSNLKKLHVLFGDVEILL